MNCQRQTVKLIKDSHRGSFEQGVGIQASLDQNVVLSESMSYRIDQILANVADARAENRGLRERVNRMSSQLRGLIAFVATNSMIAFPIINALLAMQGNVELDEPSLLALRELVRQSEEEKIPIFTAPMEPISASLNDSRARLRAAEMTAAAQAQLEVFPERAMELNERDPVYAVYHTAARRGSEFTADDEQFYQEEARIAEAEFRNDPADQVVIKKPKPGTRSQKKDAVYDTFNPHIKRVTRHEAHNLTPEQLAELATDEPETEQMDEDITPPKRKRNRSRSASKAKSGAKQLSKQAAKAKAEEAAKKKAAEEAARAAEAKAKAEAERRAAEAERVRRAQLEREAKNRKIAEAKARLAQAQAELDAAESNDMVLDEQVDQVDEEYAATHEVDKSSRRQPRGSSSDFETPRRTITNVSNAPLMMTRDITSRNAPLRSANPKKPVIVKLKKSKPQVVSRTNTPAQDRLNKFKLGAMSSQSAAGSSSVLRDKANVPPSRKARTVQTMMNELHKHRNARRGRVIKQSNPDRDDDDADSVASTGSQKRKRELSAQRNQKKQKVSRSVEIDRGVTRSADDLRRKCSNENPRYSKGARAEIRVKLLQDMDSDGDGDENENPNDVENQDENNSPDHYEDDDGYWIPANQQDGQQEQQGADGLDEDIEEIEQNQRVDLND